MEVNDNEPDVSTCRKTTSNQRRAAVTLDYILNQATEVLYPYNIEAKSGTEPDRHAAHQIGQRMAGEFSVNDAGGAERVKCGAKTSLNAQTSEVRLVSINYVSFVSFSQVPRLCLTPPPYKYAQNTSNATYLLLCDQKHIDDNSSEPSDSRSVPLPVPQPARMLLPRTSFPRTLVPIRPTPDPRTRGRWCHPPQ
jgi:hypothetical protein